MDNFITYEYEWLKKLTTELPTNQRIRRLQAALQGSSVWCILRYQGKR